MGRRIFVGFHSLLRRLKNFLPIKTKVTLARSLLTPILDYADVSYLDLNENLLDKLDRLLNLCIRFIFGLRKYDHISEYRARLNWLDIRRRRNAHTLSLLFSTLNNPCAPLYLRERFDFLCSHGVQLRSADTLVLAIPSHTSSSYTRSFTVNAARMWNSLPIDLRMSPSPFVFKKRLETHLLQ